jgi:hypothetical protein
MMKLTTESLRQIFPKAPQADIDIFVAKQVATRARVGGFCDFS